MNPETGPGVFGPLDPNIAGKATLLRMMATVIEPNAGTLRLLGRDPGSYGTRREIRRRLGYLPQALGYYRGSSARNCTRCSGSSPAVGSSSSSNSGSFTMSTPPARLIRLHLVGRGIPACLLVLAGCAVILRITLHWTPPSTGVAARQFPLLIEAGAAAAIGVVTRSPFGEPERASGRWLRFLRLGAALALTAIAFGALAAGSAAGHLDGGYLALLRDLAGMAGVALLVAAVVGGSLSWLGPVTFRLLATYASNLRWATPWAWPGRPPQDRGAAHCAGLLFATGAAVITMRGARDSVQD